MSKNRIEAARRHLSEARAELEVHKTTLSGDSHDALAEVCTAITEVRDRLDEFARRESNG